MTVQDTDGDGVPDAVEMRAGTDPGDPSSDPTARGDFYFLVPHQAEPRPSRGDLDFTPAVRRADVHFLIDTSFSMDEEISGVRSALRDRIVPGIRSSVSDTFIGASELDSCPEKVRDAKCQRIATASEPTGDIGQVERALDSMTANCGTKEPFGQSLWLFATGDTSNWPHLAREAPCAAGRGGYSCVRDDALPIAVVIGDEKYEEGDGCGGRLGFGGRDAFVPSVAEVGAELERMGAKLIVLGPTASLSEPAWTQLAEATGSVDASGRPFLFPWSGDDARIGDTVVDAVQSLAEQIPLDVSARAHDVEGDEVDATTFISRLALTDTSAGGEVACAPIGEGTDATGDGHADTLPGLRPGESVCFELLPARNETVESADEPQVYEAVLELVGDGRHIVDERRVYFLVPTGRGAPVI